MLFVDRTIAVTDVGQVPRLNASLPMDVMFQVVASNIIDVRDVQPLNALAPMDVTDEGMVTDARDSQNLNACCPMDVTEPRSTDAREVHW